MEDWLRGDEMTLEQLIETFLGGGSCLDRNIHRTASVHHIYCFQLLDVKAADLNIRHPSESPAVALRVREEM